jgi:hypothetical protein
MWQRHDLLHGRSVRQGPEKKGRRPCVLTFMRLSGWRATSASRVMVCPLAFARWRLNARC